VRPPSFRPFKNPYVLGKARDAAPPISLKKISTEENAEATVISYTSDTDFFKGKAETFSLEHKNP